LIKSVKESNKVEQEKYLKFSKEQNEKNKKEYQDEKNFKEKELKLEKESENLKKVLKKELKESFSNLTNQVKIFNSDVSNKFDLKYRKEQLYKIYNKHLYPFMQAVVDEMVLQNTLEIIDLPQIKKILEEDKDGQIKKLFKEISVKSVVKTISTVLDLTLYNIVGISVKEIKEVLKEVKFRFNKVKTIGEKSGLVKGMKEDLVG
jgi:hypothetical protein